MSHAPQPVWQFSLAALLVAMVLVNLLLGYFAVVGVWSAVAAIGPPLVIAGVIRGVIGELDRPGQSRREDLRVLGCLVAGFAIWLPVLAVWCLMP